MKVHLTSLINCFMSVNKPKRMNLLHRDSPPKNLKTCLKTPKNCLTKVFFNQIYGLSLHCNCLEKRKYLYTPLTLVQ